MTALTDCCVHARCRGARCTLPRASSTGCPTCIYLVVALDTFDYAVIVPLRRLNYLSSKAPQMLWAYVLLTVINLPHQDAVARARICSTAAAGATDASPMAAARASMHGSAVHGAHSIGSASTQAPAEKPPLLRRSGGNLREPKGPGEGINAQLRQCIVHTAVHDALFV